MCWQQQCKHVADAHWKVVGWQTWVDEHVVGLSWSNGTTAMLHIWLPNSTSKDCFAICRPHKLQMFLLLSSFGHIVWFDCYRCSLYGQRQAAKTTANTKRHMLAKVLHCSWPNFTELCWTWLFMILNTAASVLKAREANEPVCFCASSAVHSIFSSGFDSAKMIGLSHCSPIAFRISSVNRGPAAATPTITVGLICSNHKIPFADLYALAALQFERDGEVQALCNAKTSLVWQSHPSYTRILKSEKPRDCETAILHLGDAVNWDTLTYDQKCWSLMHNMLQTK